MKRPSLHLLSFMVFFSITISCATTGYSDDGQSDEHFSKHAMVVQRKFELQETKDNLFLMANEWMTMKLQGPDEGVQRENEDKGIVVGLGTVKQKSSLYEGCDVVYDFRYEINIEIKNAEVHTRIATMYGTGSGEMAGTKMNIFMEVSRLPKEDYSDLQSKLYLIINELELYLSKGSVVLDLHESAFAKFDEENYAGAIEEFTKAIKLHPGFPSSYDFRGCIRRRTGDLEGAMTDHTKALSLNPMFAYAYNNRGNVKAAMGDWEGAIEDYTKAVELGLVHPGLFNNLAQLKSATGDWEGAIQGYTAVIKHFPNYPDTYNNRGWLYLKHGKYQLALNDLNKALSMKEKASYYDSRGWANFFLSRLEEARNDALSALELDSELYFSRALIYRVEVQKGNKEEALKELRKYLLQHEGEKGRADAFLVLQYFVDEVTLEQLRNNPHWEDLKLALENY